MELLSPTLVEEDQLMSDNN